MKREEGSRTEKPWKKCLLGINRDVAVFAFFLFLSFIFWYLNSLGKENETGIKYQVEYTNIPKERVITSEQPDELNLFLKVNYKRSPGDKALNYYIVTSGLTKSLNAQIRSGCEITSIKPDTLFFTLEKVVANSAVIPENKRDNKKKQ